MKILFLVSLLCLLPGHSSAHGVYSAVERHHADSIATKKQRTTTETTREVGRPRYRTQGYRIQVFTGGNDRAAKRAAQEMKTKIQKHFPELSVYIHFQSPRWVCRVGDFLSREEAQHYVKQIRKKRLSPEAAIVKSPVLRAY